MTEPLHLNLIALLVAIAGSFRAKVAFDLVLRQQHAFSLLKAADYAKELGIPRITAIEVGVAAAARLPRSSGVLPLKHPLLSQEAESRNLSHRIAAVEFLDRQLFSRENAVAIVLRD